MISLIEALDFRCLRYIHQPLGPFHILVGPNASGKTTFLDVIAFLGQLVYEGLEIAIKQRTRNFKDLVWGRKNDKFELAIEAIIPEHLRNILQRRDFSIIRYEVSIGIDQNTQELAILAEKALLKEHHKIIERERTLFPMEVESPRTILTQSGIRGSRTIVNKVPGGNDNYYSEVYPESGKGWAPAFKFGPRKSALGNLPGDESKFPVSTWLKDLLSEGVQQFILNSMLIRLASPPGQVRKFIPDGSNLPWVIHRLKQKYPNKFQDWICHLQTALPDIKDIITIEREDDKHRYLVIIYQDGLEVPSWVASDGTLRLLALTLPAYLPDFKGIYLVEEPENGIHPSAVETMFQSLSSVYDAQMLLATHSPVILSIADIDKVLCFKKTNKGATDIVLGSDHPLLKEWKGETDLGTLFVSGVLG
jgi:predicted ATPase